jgi:hypothetical protein
MTSFGEELLSIIKMGGLRAHPKATQGRKRGIPPSKDDLTPRDKSFSSEGMWPSGGTENASFVTRTGF